MGSGFCLIDEEITFSSELLQNCEVHGYSEYDFARPNQAGQPIGRFAINGARIIFDGCWTRPQNGYIHYRICGWVESWFATSKCNALHVATKDRQRAFGTGVLLYAFGGQLTTLAQRLTFRTSREGGDGGKGVSLDVGAGVAAEGVTHLGTHIAHLVVIGGHVVHVSGFGAYGLTSAGRQSIGNIPTSLILIIRSHLSAPPISNNQKRVIPATGSAKVDSLDI
jgi:hypothetical protein